MIMSALEVTTGVYQISGLWGTGVWGANVFLLVGDDLTLVDTGFKGRSAQILKAIQRLGYSPSDITSIIITHHHGDHVGNLAVLQEVARARVAAHPADAPYIDGRLPQPGPERPAWVSKAFAPFGWLWATAPVAVDVLVNDGEELPILGGIRVLHTPGHTPGSISLLLERTGVVIVGDVLAHRFRLDLPSRAFTVDIAQEIRSIRRVASLEFDVICFGHGLPLMRRARPTVVDFARALEAGR